MDPTTNPTTIKNMNTAPAAIIADDADITIDNAFSDIMGVAQLSEAPDSIYHFFVASPMYAGFGDLGNQERVYFLEDFSKMTPSLRKYLTSSDTVEIIFSIGKDFELGDGQISLLGVQIRELLTGKIFIQDFPKILADKLSLNDIKAGELANKLISQSFGPIIEDVKRIQRNKFPDKISQIQKESQPAGLAPAKPSISPDIKNMPLNRPQPQPAQTPPTQTSQPPRPTEPPKPRMPPPPMQSAPTVRPAPVLPKPPVIDLPKPQPTPVTPAPSMPPRPETPPPSPAPATPKPQFKMPTIDLSGMKPGAAPGPAPVNKELGGVNSEKSKQSLEDELEKIANVIDLKNKESS